MLRLRYLLEILYHLSCFLKEASKDKLTIKTSNELKIEVKEKQ